MIAVKRGLDWKLGGVSWALLLRGRDGNGSHFIMPLFWSASLLRDTTSSELDSVLKDAHHLLAQPWHNLKYEHVQGVPRPLAGFARLPWSSVRCEPIASTPTAPSAITKLLWGPPLQQGKHYHA